MSVRFSHFIFAVLIILLGTTVYTNSLPNPFIWDDIGLVIENSHIKQFGFIPRLFRENVYHKDMSGKFYRPVLMSSFAVDYSLWELNPFGYHLTNLILHLANTLLIYMLIQLIFGNSALSFLTAVFFVIHPVQTEAVTYVAGRADPLAGFFCLFSAVCFVRFYNASGRSRAIYYIGAVLSFLLAILTKEPSIIFFSIFLVYEACFGKTKFSPKSLYKYLPFVIVLVLYAAVREAVLGNVKNAILTGDSFPLTTRLMVIPLALARYLRILVFPIDLHMERMDFIADAPISLFEWRILTAFSVLALLFLLIWATRRSLKPALFGSVWFIAGLLPVLNIAPINAFIAEHWLYLPSIGFFLSVSAVLVKLAEFERVRLVVLIMATAFFTWLGVLTVRQNEIWSNPVVFYKHILKYSPQSARVHSNLGNVYLDSNLYDQAEMEYKEALKLDPFGVYSANFYVNLGVLSEKKDNPDEAVKMYKKALEVNPDFALSYLYLGNLSYKSGKLDDAVRNYKRAAELTPTNATYWYKLANAYLKSKMLNEAAIAYEKALEIYPYYLVARVNLGNIYMEQGNLRKAVEQYEAALRLAPDVPQIYFNIAALCARAGELKTAKEFLEKTLELDPNYKEAKEMLEELKKSGY